MLSKVHLGTDPQLEKAEARAQVALTLGGTVKSYLGRHAARRLKPKTFKDVERYLQRTARDILRSVFRIEGRRGRKPGRQKSE
jgi:hypothetical protein